MTKEDAGTKGKLAKDNDEDVTLIRLDTVAVDETLPIISKRSTRLSIDCSVYHEIGAELREVRIIDQNRWSGWKATRELTCLVTFVAQMVSGLP